MGRPLAHERGEGVWGNREVPPPSERRGSVGETWFPPRERAGCEGRSFLLLVEALPQCVNCPAQARVDGSARKLEHPGYLARRVLEQETQNDDGPVLGRQRRQGQDHVV